MVDSTHNKVVVSQGQVNPPLFIWFKPPPFLHCTSYLASRFILKAKFAGNEGKTRYGTSTKLNYLYSIL